MKPVGVSNWIGRVTEVPNKACYRRSYLSDDFQCAFGYEFNTGTCWALCSLDHPVPCGLECLPQNSDCGAEVLGKIAAVAEVILNVATEGVFGELKSGIKAGVQVTLCGVELGNTIRALINLINQAKLSQPNHSKEQLRALVEASAIISTDLPNAALTCMGKEPGAGFERRNKIIKLASVLIEHVLDTTEDENGTPLSAADFEEAIIELSLGVLESFDPTGLVSLVDQFAEDLCDLPVLYGDIDDGPADQAVGMNAIDIAFQGSSGQWTFHGDGMVSITFQSSDFQPLVVNVISGGKKIDSVFVPIKKRIIYTKRIQDLQDRTLYLDRWRAGFGGIAGTGGGSLSMWVPHSSQGGHLQVTALLNPTSSGSVQKMYLGDNHFYDNDYIKLTRVARAGGKCTITLKCSLGWWKGITDETTDDGDPGQREIVSTQDSRTTSSYTDTADYHNRHQYMLAKAKAFGIHTPMYPLVFDFENGYEYIFEWLQQ
ncbi:TPA: hypothetical protein N0F65_011531 [Lagenidium giganteum]|uniref:Uncharacterized protein n=1 Tax=Lagenidium giganteum TaxID=4803 RepID=A0AAV2Z6T4_9STRA|nr:TPA: hypothetical protein N0F65_011531 [Lagenidium giganteum]